MNTKVTVFVLSKYNIFIVKGICNNDCCSMYSYSSAIEHYQQVTVLVLTVSIAIRIFKL